MTITLLQTGHLITPLPLQQTTASHQRACLIRDEYDKSVQAHIKAFPATSNGLPNEIVGHILHHLAGIATAPRGWIIELTSAELARLFPDANWGRRRIWPCWATEHLPGMPINASSAWDWADELASWHGTPSWIALHEWVWNIDGNGGNLLGLGAGEFASIDHADILGGACWTKKSLRDGASRRFYNKALHIAWRGTPTSAQRLAARERAALHADILEKGWPVIAYWLSPLLSTSEIAALHAFLHARSAPHWIDHRI